MRITFLGTSHGLPEAHRRCSCTMLEVQGRVYFVDMGLQAIEDLTNMHISTESVKAVFITHMHGDHTNGLISLVELASWYYKQCNPEIYLPLLEGHDALQGWLSAVGVTLRDGIVFRQVKTGVIFDDGYLRVTAAPTKHFHDAFCYLVEAEGKKIVFTGDLDRPDSDFPVFAKENSTDLIICEGAHFSAMDYLPHLRQCDTRQVCVNHYAPWNIPNIQNLAKELKDIPVFMANDGMIINL